MPLPDHPTAGIRRLCSLRHDVSSLGLALVLALGVGCTSGGGGNAGSVPAAPADPGFTLAASPAHLAVPAGETGSVVITISRFSGLTGPVALTGVDLPAGITLAAAASGASDSQQVTLDVAPGVAPQSFTAIKVRGAAGLASSGITLAIDVMACRSFPVPHPETVEASSAFQSGGPYRNEGICLEPAPAITQTGANSFPVNRVGYFPELP
jgi:hypothetical protein